MKEILISLSQYNFWANQLLTGTILSLPSEKHTQDVGGSFKSLQATTLHMLDAESIWWQRMKLAEKIERPSEGFSGDMQEVQSRLLSQNRNWMEWIQQAHEYALQHEFIYQDSKREQFKQPVYQMLVHVFNHGTFHRGQLVTQLRLLGADKIPSTDFIAWTRKRS